MSDTPARSKEIDVEHVQPGLYVHQLDRPWLETPFLFQGFRVENDTEIQTLREYCNRVFIDLDRSDVDAVSELMARAPTAERVSLNGDAGGPTGDPASVKSRLDSPLFSSNPIVDQEEFGSSVERAAASRGRLRRAIGDALRAVVSDRAVEVKKTRGAVAHIAETIQEDPTASLWLTRLSSNDDYTSRHAVNACVLALTFGRHLGFDREALENIGMGTLLMDVGRMIVPGNVFPKPGKLSEKEWSYVQRHVTDGVRLLSHSKVPDDALEIVRSHHERLLGQGYPEGLLADRIPETALMAGLVDSYDAMLHKRPYREAYRPDEAIQLLYKDAKSTFGEELVSSFIWYLGSYPVGTVVELDNGAIGVVVGTSPGHGVWPTVLLVRDAEGNPYRRRVLLNLAAVNRRGNKKDEKGRHIRRTLNPREAKVPVGKIVATEFGLDRLKLEGK